MRGERLAVGDAFDSAEAVIGPVDILINNAGGVESAPFSRTTVSIFQRMVELNLTTVFLCCARALPSMVKNDFGRIVNVASTAGLDGFPFVSAYVAAKHGVVGLTRSLAKEVGPNINVNAVCPGYTDTEMLQSSARHVARQSGRELAAVLDKYREANPSGQLIEASEVAAAILKVCLDGDMRGEAVVVDGQKEAP